VVVRLGVLARVDLLDIEECPDFPASLHPAFLHACFPFVFNMTGNLKTGNRHFGSLIAGRSVMIKGSSSF
jgi:hypothetical protein